jgi:tetratricopeptide (TPR) repeat protein
VRRTYLAARSHDVRLANVSRAIAEPARGWLEDAIRWARKLDPASVGTETSIEPMGAVRRARWLVSLAGASAAAWVTGGDERGEGELVAHAVALARERDPSAWTLEDLLGKGGPAPGTWDPGNDDERVVRVVRELSRSAPDPAAIELAENELARGRAPAAMAFPLAAALARGGETGRAWAALAATEGAEADAFRGELARRRGQTAVAEAMARRALGTTEPATRGAAQATLGRLAWDAGDLDETERRLEGARGPAAAEVRALVAWRRGTYESALRALDVALAEPLDADVVARLENVKGLLELSRGASVAALRCFGRAVELAARAGAVLEEATYLTSEAAAASDAGDLARALASATRAALLWERLARPDRAARAWLARAGSLASIGVAHGADEAAEEARARALASRDEQAVAYARWAQVEVRPAGDERARGWAIEADDGGSGTLRGAPGGVGAGGDHRRTHRRDRRGRAHAVRSGALGMVGRTRRGHPRGTPHRRRLCGARGAARAGRRPRAPRLPGARPRRGGAPRDGARRRRLGPTSGACAAARRAGPS